MILPTKHITYDLSLIGISSGLLRKLDRPQTVSLLWQSFQSPERQVTFNSFILALDFLYLSGALDIVDGLLTRHQP